MSGPKANNAGPETNVSGPELDNNTSACALSFLLLAFFQIGQSHFGNCDGIGLKTSSNELALHAESGKINLLRLVAEQVHVGRFLPDGILLQVVGQSIHDISIRFEYQIVKRWCKMQWNALILLVRGVA